MDTSDIIEPMLPGDFSPSASEHLDGWHKHMQARQRNRKISKELGSSTPPTPQSQHTVHAVSVVGSGPTWAKHQWELSLKQITQLRAPEHWPWVPEYLYKESFHNRSFELWKIVLRGGSMTALIFISRPISKQ